jgi:hypothetical protein
MSAADALTALMARTETASASFFIEISSDAPNGAKM